MAPRLAFFAVAGVAAGREASPEHLAMIGTIQNTAGVQWKAGVVPRFSQDGALKPLMGVTAEAMASRANYAAEQAPKLAAVELPEEFDSETNWPQCANVIGDIRDQSNCGCCWAFAAASAGSDRLCIATNASMLLPLSAQDVCFCASMNGCGGGDIHSPWSHMKFGIFGTGGAVTGGQFNDTGPFSSMCSDFTLAHCHHHGPQGDDPYPAEGAPGCPSASSPRCPSACGATAKAPHNDFKSDKIGFKGSVQSASGADGIAQAIMAGGPVETAFTVYSDFANYVSGVYHHVSGGVEGGHAVRIVGWGVDAGQKYWKVANSWNPYWGEKGYFRIRRGGSECGVEDQVTFSSPSAKWGKKGDFTFDTEALVV